MNDIHDRGFQIVQIAVTGEYHLFPIPLIYINGMQIVQDLLVATYCIHISIQSLPGKEVVPLQSQALPFCKGVYDLRGAVCVENLKFHRAFITVQIIIDSGILSDEQRG